MTQTILNTPALAVEFMRHVAPDGVPVDSGVTPALVARRPIAVVTTTAPRAVPNGPIGAGTYFRLNVSVFSGSRTRACMLQAAGVAIEIAVPAIDEPELMASLRDSGAAVDRAAASL